MQDMGLFVRFHGSQRDTGYDTPHCIGMASRSSRSEHI